MLGIVDKIPHYEEIIDKTHAFYNAELIFKPFGKLAVRPPVTRFHSAYAQLMQILVVIPPVRHIERRKMPFPELKLKAAFFGNFRRVVNRFGHVREKGAHFILAFKVKLVRFKVHSVIIVKRFSCLDAKQHVLILRVLTHEIVRVVRGDKRRVRFARKLNEERIQSFLILNSVILKLYVKLVKKLLIFVYLCFGTFKISV